jgi:hypothetical protein
LGLDVVVSFEIAIVRATRKTLSWARADKPRSSMAAFKRNMASGLSAKNLRNWGGVVRPFTCVHWVTNRFACRAQASIWLSQQGTKRKRKKPENQEDQQRARRLQRDTQAV